MILSFLTDRSGQTVQTKIRLILEEQSDQGLHCLLFHLHLFDKIPLVQTKIRLILEEQSDQGLHCLLFHLHLFDKIPSGLASLFEY